MGEVDGVEAAPSSRRAPGSPYDLRVTGGDEQTRVEVKGRSSETSDVTLTYREVVTAREYRDAALAVVDGIVVSRGSDDGVTAAGGRLRIWRPAAADR